MHSTTEADFWKVAVEKSAARVRAWDMRNADDLRDQMMLLDLACERAGVRLSDVICTHDVPTRAAPAPFCSSAPVWGIDGEGYAVHGRDGQSVTHFSTLPT